MIGVALLFAAFHGAAAPPPVAAQSPQYQLPLPYLTPIPVVRLAGSLTKTGARVTLLRIKAPRGSLITVRCAGGRKRGCKRRSKTKRAPRSGRVRFREFERRLRAGVRLRMYVRRGNTVGKYTSFTIRKRKFPARRDLCLLPGDPFQPRRCP